MPYLIPRFEEHIADETLPILAASDPGLFVSRSLEFQQENDTQTSSFDLVFQCMSAHTRIPRDFTEESTTFAQHIANEIKTCCRHIDDNERRDLFSKCCRLGMLALAQFLWQTSSTKQQLEPLFVDCEQNTQTCRDFLEFGWTCAPSTFQDNVLFLASSALRKNDFVMWEFLASHGLLLQSFLVSSNLWSEMCVLDAKFLKLVWIDDRLWTTVFPKMLECAIISQQASVVRFLSQRDLMKYINPWRWQRHMLSVVSMNAVSLVRYLPFLGYGELFDMCLQRAVHANHADLFYELLRLGTLVDDDVRKNNFELFVAACSSCLSVALFLTRTFPQILADASFFLTNSMPYAKDVMESIHWDLNFNKKLPAIFC